MKDLPGRLKKLRKGAGLNQSDFAVRLGITQSYVSALERNAKLPSDLVIKSICNAMRINETWLRDGVGPMMAAGGGGLLPDDSGGEGGNGNSNVVALDSHQSLVAGFRQRALAEEINQVLLDIERLDPGELVKIKMNLESTRKFLELKAAEREAAKDPGGEKTNQTT